MKKFFALILAILLVMSLFTTAVAEDWDDEYPDIYLDDSELAEIVGPYYGRIYVAARFKNGAVAIMDDDKVGYFENGNLVMEWSHPTSNEDYFFDVSYDYPDAEYDLCAILCDQIVSFYDDLTMRVEVNNVFSYAIGDDAVFAYDMADDRSLYYWSPYVRILIDTDVYEVSTFYGITFISDKTGVSILGVKAFDIGKMPQRFYNHHFVPLIPLGNYSIGDYVAEAYGDELEPDDQRMSAFFKKYDIKFSEWGETKLDFSIEDFAEYPYMTVNSILSAFAYPDDEYADPLMFSDIAFYGNAGDLLVYLANEVEIKQIRWVSTSDDPDLVDELFGLVASRCDYEGSGNADGEEVYRSGDQLIHVGCQEDGRVYIYANNMRKVNE